MNLKLEKSYFRKSENGSVTVVFKLAGQAFDF